MINRLSIVGLVLFATSMANASESIRDLRIFQNDATVVNLDTHVDSDTAIIVHNMDDRIRAKSKLNDAVKSRVRKVSGNESLEDVYRQAFSDLLNGSEWNGLVTEMQNSLVPVSTALRYQIQKLPAIVINDKEVVYGVTSLRKAIQIYERNGGAQ